MGEQGYGICPEATLRWARALAQLLRKVGRLALVIGAGNLYRGRSSQGLPRVAADQLGMVATLMNGIALREVLLSLGVAACAMSGLPCPSLVESYSWREARLRFAAGELLILVGGTGHPFFTTDSGAALYSCQMGVDLVIKATNVDGVYEKDPRLHPESRRFATMSYSDLLSRQLTVIDGTAAALCRDNSLPLLVCNKQLLLEESFGRALVEGKQLAQLGTLVREGLPLSFLA